MHPELNNLDNINLRVFSRYQARDLLIAKFHKDPELFLQKTTNLDKGVIYSIFLEEGEKLNLDFHKQTIEDTPITSPYIRAQYDLEIDIPFRIALIGWMLVDSFPDRVLQRIFNYSFYKPEEELSKFFNTQLEYILKGYTTREIIEEVFDDSRLNKFIHEKLMEVHPL
jgi:hypothetical protein